MGFQDNSGDIIFDVVLTDEGRKRLSEGDFQITKFKCSDDEINYELYDKENPNGSDFYDLQILQTPVFEAFTNNTSNMSSLLVSYDSQDLLYLPIIKLNTLKPQSLPTAMHSSGSFMVAVNTDTAGADALSSAYISNKSIAIDSNGTLVDGFLFGADEGGGMILIDSGLDTGEFPPSSTLSQLPDGMNETGYIIEMDNRLGTLIDQNRAAIQPEIVDDDNIAIYTLDATSDSNFVVDNHEPQGNNNQTIEGYRFKSLRFKIQSSLNLRQSNFYFNKFGGTTSMMDKSGTTGTNNVYYIDTLIKVTGIDTGYSIEIPIRYIKLKS